MLSLSLSPIHRWHLTYRMTPTPFNIHSNNIVTYMWVLNEGRWSFDIDKWEHQESIALAQLHASTSSDWHEGFVLFASNKSCSTMCCNTLLKSFPAYRKIKEPIYIRASRVTSRKLLTKYVWCEIAYSPEIWQMAYPPIFPQCSLICYSVLHRQWQCPVTVYTQRNDINPWADSLSDVGRGGVLDFKRKSLRLGWEKVHTSPST